MSIIDQDHYKLLNNEDPNIILYLNVFSQELVKNITNNLQEYEFKDSYLWFADNISLTYNKKILTKKFPLFLESIRSKLESIIGYSFNSCLVKRYDRDTEDIYVIKQPNKFDKDIISPVFFFGSLNYLKFISKKNKEVKNIKVSNGSLLIQKYDFFKNWYIQTKNNGIFYSLHFMFINDPEKINKNCLKSYKTIRKRIPINLEKIYINNSLREKNSLLIKQNISKIHKISLGKQCVLSNGINTLKKYIKLIKLIGTGDWGNVYSSYTKNLGENRTFAIKMSRISKDDLKNPYSDSSSSWYETWILKDIFRPLIVKNVCPNLPLFIDTFLCDNCDFIFRQNHESHPCIVTAVELANGDFKDYLKYGSPSTEELYSALFQIMAGLYAIQMSGQILNNDIKSRNILYYNVSPGGFWKYRIDNIDFYVPNYGKIFILNDFGVSTLYNPNFQLYPNKRRSLFNLGSRYAINMDGIFSPIEANLEVVSNKLQKTGQIKWIDKNNQIKISKGASYKLNRKTGQVIISHTFLTENQKSYLFRKGITTNPKTWNFFEHPSVIPPFEFYNDTQDVLRIFVGGKRTTQQGNHKLYKSVSEEFKNNIKQYLGQAENSKSKIFSPYSYHVLAGDFIKKFFSQTHNYLIKPKGKKISYYNMNKCLKQ
jgi:hypothetical protein